MPWTTATTRSSGFAVTAAVWNAEHVDNMNFLKRIDYAEQITDVTVNTTTEGTAVSVVSLTSKTYEASVTRFEFYAPSLDTNAATMHITLFDGSTAVGDLFQGAGSGNADTVGCLTRYLTPTAAAHTYNVKAWISSGSGLIHAGAGGTGGTRMPIYLAAFRVPT